MLRLALGTLLLGFARAMNPQTVTNCEDKHEASFVKISHSGDDPMGTAEVVVPASSLERCAGLCAENADGLGGAFACAGFDFLAQRAACMLSSSLRSSQLLLFDELVQLEPTLKLCGDVEEERAVQNLSVGLAAFPDLAFLADRDARRIQRQEILNGTKKELVLDLRATPRSGDPTGFYRKVCLPAVVAAFVPLNATYTFEQVVNRVLPGSTEELLKSQSLPQCLGACLGAKELFAFACRSAMYSYETEDCLLNSLDRSTAPRPLSDDTDGLRVDYFESHVTAEPGAWLADNSLWPSTLPPRTFTEQFIHPQPPPVNLSVFRDGTAQLPTFGTQIYALSQPATLPQKRIRMTRAPGAPSATPLPSTATQAPSPTEELVGLSRPSSFITAAPILVKNGDRRRKIEARARKAHRLLLQIRGWDEAKRTAGLRARFLTALPESHSPVAALVLRGLRKHGLHQGTVWIAHWLPTLANHRPTVPPAFRLPFHSVVPRPSADLGSLIGSLLSNRLVSEQAECGRGTLGSYVEVEGVETAGEHDFTILGVSLRSCQHFCTANRGEHGEEFPCEAFAYDSATQNCYLMDEGPGRTANRSLDVAAGDTSSTTRLFEKICLSADNACLRQPAFRKTPDKVFPGFASVILEETRSLERCLSECTASLSVYGFVCLSAMFYYDKAECVLNTEAQSRHPQAAFMTLTKAADGRVDYFENLCARQLTDEALPSNACPQGLQATFAEWAGRGLGPNLAASLIDGLTLHECLAECELAANFTCRSADYRVEEAACELSFAASDNAVLRPAEGAAHLDRLCVEGAGRSCGGLGVSFAAFQAARLPAQPFILISGVSLEECLSLCLQDPSRLCRSLDYAARNSSCALHDRGVQTEAELVPAEDLAHYTSRCQANLPAIKETKEQPSFLGETAAQRTGDVEIITDCSYGGIKVTAASSRPFTGHVFAKNRFQTCRVDVADESEGVLSLPFPRPGVNVPARSEAKDATAYGGKHRQVPLPAEEGCGVVHEGGDVYTATVVVTTNNLGVPGLVTESDRIFRVKCDYSSTANSKVTARGPSMVVDNAEGIPVLYPDGEMHIPSPMAIYLKDQGSKVANAQLGDNLELAFDYMPSMNRSSVGVFVRQCNASRGYGPPPQPQPLSLIEDGCPTPAVDGTILTGPIQQTSRGFDIPITVFKFDGSPYVKVACLVDFCEGPCNPTTCRMAGRNEASFGRKKREIQPREEEKLDATTSTPKPTKAKLRKTEEPSFVFVVLDGKSVTESQDPSTLPPMVKVLPANESSMNSLRSSSLSAELFFRGTMNGQKAVCLRPATFLAVFLFIATLSLILVICAACIFVSHYLSLEDSKES